MRGQGEIVKVEELDVEYGKSESSISRVRDLATDRLRVIANPG